jgi:hypothetical protein
MSVAGRLIRPSAEWWYRMHGRVAAAGKKGRDQLFCLRLVPKNSYSDVLFCLLPVHGDFLKGVSCDA